jgi:hypothetical protein
MQDTTTGEQPAPKPNLPNPAEKEPSTPTEQKPVSLQIEDPALPCYAQNLKGSTQAKIKSADYNFNRWFFHILFNQSWSPQKLRELLKFEEITGLADTREIETSRGERFVLFKGRLQEKGTPTANAGPDWATEKFQTETDKVWKLVRFYQLLNQKRGEQPQLLGSTLSFLATLCPLATRNKRSVAEQILGYQHAIYILALGETPKLQRSKKAELETFASGWKSTAPWTPENSKVLDTTGADWFKTLSTDWEFPLEETPREAPEKGPELAAWIACHPDWANHIPDSV